MVLDGFDLEKVEKELIFVEDIVNNKSCYPKLEDRKESINANIKHLKGAATFFELAMVLARDFDQYELSSLLYKAIQREYDIVNNNKTFTEIKINLLANKLAKTISDIREYITPTFFIPNVYHTTSLFGSSGLQGQSADDIYLEFAYDELEIIKNCLLELDKEYSNYLEIKKNLLIAIIYQQEIAHHLEDEIKLFNSLADDPELLSLIQAFNYYRSLKDKAGILSLLGKWSVLYRENQENLFISSNYAQAMLLSTNEGLLDFETDCQFPLETCHYRQDYFSLLKGGIITPNQEKVVDFTKC